VRAQPKGNENLPRAKGYKAPTTIDPDRPHALQRTRGKYTTAQAVAWKFVEDLMGKSYRVLNRELDDRQTVALVGPDGMPLLKDDGTPQLMEIGGNWQVAKFILERMTQSQGSLLMREITVDLSNMEGVMAAADQILQSLFRREVSVGDATKVMDLLIKYASLRSYEGMTELRAMMADITGRTIDGRSGPAPGTPTWGRLQASTPTANEVPGE
jgi:hypothetical protein